MVKSNNMKNGIDYCVLCEARGDDNVEAEFRIEFNGDVIPVCAIHYDLVKSDNLYDILDEQSDE